VVEMIVWLIDEMTRTCIVVVVVVLVPQDRVVVVVVVVFVERRGLKMKNI
jgi:hypothetical protein